MTRPTRVKIGPLWYTVEWTDKGWQVESQRFGECAPNVQVLRIMDKCEPDRIACVFAHEVAHAIAFNTDCWDEVKPEQACDLASYGMVQFWQDNPQAFEWWSRLIKETSHDRHRA